jgi:hypothetical protein
MSIATQRVTSLRLFCSVSALVILGIWSGLGFAQTTAFTYSGKLTDNGNPANGNFDLQFALFDNAQGGAQIGANQTVPGTAVNAGVFTVQLDFGVNAFPGANRFLEIGVRPAGVGNFTVLDPRQQISSTPYAIRTLSAGAADALSGNCIACVQDSHISSVAGTKLTGSIPVASMPAGSGNYIQNSAAQQAGANFNINGTGTVGSLNANGAISTAGISAPAVAPAGQGRIYYDSAANKLKASENGSPYVNLIGATGVSGSGTASFLPLWTAGTTQGNSVVTQSGGNIGIGTTTPQSKLQVDGELVLNIAGPTIHTGTLNGELNAYVSLINSPSYRSASGLKAGGVLVADSYTYANPGKNDLIVKGKVGVGNVSPYYQLEVTGQIRATGVAANDVIAETSAGTNSWARMVMKSPQQEWALGTSQNYNGNQIYLSDDTFAQARMTIQPNGGSINFPIGHVALGDTGPHDARLYVNSASTSTGFALFADGSVGQAASKFGLPKAMLLVRENGNGAPYIERCYNAVSNTLSAPCGFGVSQPGGIGIIHVSFPFRVSDRFISLTAFNNAAAGLTSYARVVQFDATDISGGTVSVSVEGYNGGYSDFYMIVF